MENRDDMNVLATDGYHYTDAAPPQDGLSPFDALVILQSAWRRRMAGRRLAQAAQAARLLLQRMLQEEEDRRIAADLAQANEAARMRWTSQVRARLQQ